MTYVESFQQLKDAFTTGPVLQYTELTKPFVITTDANGFSVGAILNHGKIGQYKPIA